ncbi:hypothetical protein [Crocosphaera chwakensis]|uniref:Uncharacterized protein n=1 Tax=Crocosphaera chwakensis CCY0110 TaxID=391612 RepID=A3IR35_9CHRO|nr:hypothetical protein [Crocosphaera chwakensis]EAZ91025.1 hypothetical protein CY0110_27475 [Crocosphaera chwakensis CCY0110]
MTPIDEMLPEYDFSQGVRGKHYQAYREGHSVTINQEDGTTVVQNFVLEEGTIILDPDVKEYFPDSESVNHALRTLINLIPKSREK